MAQASHHPQPTWLQESGGVAVVMVPLPAQGHLNQLLHLSRIISSYGVPVHYVAAMTHIQQVKLRLHSWDPASSVVDKGGKHHQLLHFHGFEIPSFPSPSPDPNSISKFPSQLLPAFEAASFHLRRHVADLVRSLASGSRRVAVIHDSLMGSAVQDTPSVSKAESYVFHSVSAFSLCWFMSSMAVGWQPLLGEYPDIFLKDPPTVEGCFPAEFLKFTENQYKFRQLSSGFIHNTSRIMEGPFMELLKKERANMNQWAVGPFNPVKIQSESPTGKQRPDGAPKHKCIEWLDRHPKNTVIYVSFGTTIALSKDQIQEIALGLEGSGRRFIWVLRQADKGDIFSGEPPADRKTADSSLPLPIGFEQRIEGVGLVMREWAPQLEILGHPSVGGFMTHCGWNSCMESMSMGVPIVAWPMHSDQPGNSILLTRILKIGIMVDEWLTLVKGGLVESPSIKLAVDVLMGSEEGDKMRERAEELGKAIRRSTDNGGISRAELDSFMAHITR
ncbi:hypothetical protein SAY87_023939 [Trapa incisa]|uniref:Glycosyltransferase n=1 Tax=Trapa incisa TaxID=236973 RepID=A0AAN7KTE1_9MYRT|nr:hypothetical protein SAY87_023939 [Trapa incisa]